MRAKFHGQPFRDHQLGKWLITFETDELPNYDDLRGSDLELQVKEYRKKRSLNANSYFHVLAGKIAEATGQSHTEAHNHLIAEYGQMDAEVQNIIMDDDIPYLKLETLHLRPTTATRLMDNGKLYRVYYVMRGSHTYDQKEMSRLIEGTVFEAKELGIETMTPDQIKQMLSTMEVNNGKQK